MEPVPNVETSVQKYGIQHPTKKNVLYGWSTHLDQRASKLSFLCACV